jgi:hypothetical protein
MPNIFWLNLKDWSNRFDGEFSSKCVLCKGIEREDLVSAEVGIDKIVVESYVAGVSFTETFSDDSGRITSRGMARAGELDRAMSSNRDWKF